MPEYVTFTFSGAAADALIPVSKLTFLGRVGRLAMATVLVELMGVGALGRGSATLVELVTVGILDWLEFELAELTGVGIFGRGGRCSLTARTTKEHSFG